MDSEPSNLHAVITNIRINTIQELEQVWTLSLEIKDSTPHSFKEMQELKIILNMHEFNSKSQEDLSLIEKKLESMQCLPVLPQELFYCSYPDKIQCPNPTCANSG